MIAIHRKNEVKLDKITGASVVLPVFAAPDWVLKVMIVFVAIGFPIAVIFSWAFEVTPEGLKLEADVDRSQSITSETAKKLDRVTIALVVVAAIGIGKTFDARQDILAAKQVPAG